MVNMFVSYCQRDSVYADNIDLYFKDKNVSIHRDIRDISSWKSIRDYMKTIRDMDYAILIVSDNYLKSFNCMHEVLELIKEKNYEHKIFPVVVEKSIYEVSGRIPYIKYWQDKFKELQSQIIQLDVVNAGNIIDDLKRTQNIVLSIDEFLSKIADMNNPSLLDVNKLIENKLIEEGLLSTEKVAAESRTQETQNIFSSLKINRVNTNSEPTDLEKNKFMSDSFADINRLLGELCRQVEKENNNLQIQIEKVDNRTVIYDFYKNGNQVRTLKLFFGSFFGGRDNNIGISCDYSFGNNNSFNEIISSKFENGKLFLNAMMLMSLNKRNMSIEDTVKEIWTRFIQPYLSR